MNIYCFVLFSLLWNPLLFSHEDSNATPPLPSSSQLLTFEMLKNEESRSPFLNKTVQIGGFLHKSEKGEWILAPMPSIKTCCIGATAKQDEQIYLEGHWEGSSSASVIALHGTFRKDLKTGKFYLEEANILKRESNGLPLKLLVIMSLLGIGALFFFLKRK